MAQLLGLEGRGLGRDVLQGRDGGGLQGGQGGGLHRAGGRGGGGGGCCCCCWRWCCGGQDGADGAEEGGHGGQLSAGDGLALHVGRVRQQHLLEAEQLVGVGVVGPLVHAVVRAALMRLLGGDRLLSMEQLITVLRPGAGYSPGGGRFHHTPRPFQKQSSSCSRGQKMK